VSQFGVAQKGAKFVTVVKKGAKFVKIPLFDKIQFGLEFNTYGYPLTASISQPSTSFCH
jgi:hypothetical protein